ncbi:hypothetical protein GCM10020216_083540 [Nonomuraea helvata]
MTGTGAAPYAVPQSAGGKKPFATRAGVRRLVHAAVAAPSVHNTQPWRFRRVDDATMDLYADLDRLPAVTDPHGARARHQSRGRPAQPAAGDPDDGARSPGPTAARPQ